MLKLAGSQYGQTWDMIMFQRGGCSEDREKETEVAWVNRGKQRVSLRVASFVAGARAYVLGVRGAAKVVKSRFHESLFCYDDFLNITNSHRHRRHINGQLHDLSCVQRVMANGGLTILVVEARKSKPKTFTYPLVKHLESSHRSDTRYPITE